MKITILCIIDSVLSPTSRLSLVGMESTTPTELACALCKVHHSHMSLISTWNSDSAREFVSERGISEENVVCRPCRGHISKVLEHPNFEPGWEKQKIKSACFIQGCTEPVFSRCHLEEMERAIELTKLPYDIDTTTPIPTPLPLCKCHYHMIYKHQNPPTNTNCPTCDVALKHTKARPCPNPAVIEHHLKKKHWL